MPGVMRTPRHVDIDITNRCNLRCDYCYHFSSEGDVQKDLPTEEWLQFFDELGACSVMDVTLAGGEPFIRSDLFDLLDGIVRNRMRFSILSNGTLITEKIAELLAGTGRCNHVQVSIDGACADIHETFRGKGTFDKAVNGIRVLQKHAVPVAVRVTIHHRNVHDLENVARLLLDELKLPSFSTNAASYLGLCRDHEDAVSLTIEDRMLAMRTLQELNTRYEGRIGAQAGPLAEARMWTEMIDRLEKNEPGDSCGGSLSSCGCSNNTMAVRADGVFVPCTLLPMIELGRINQDPLKEVWQNHPEMQRFRQRQLIHLSDFAHCRECVYSPHCRGGCPGVTVSMIGDPYRPGLDSCLRRFQEDGGVVPFQQTDE